MSSRIYFISGLGADRRAFKRLIFPSDFELIYLDWIPAQQKESLTAYAERIALGIDTSTPFYLVGLSFGGMLATEIAKKLNPVHTFLISSTPTFKELPWYYRIAGKLSLHKLIPIRLLRNKKGIGMRFLGAQNPDERNLLLQLVTDSDPYFMKWALTSILTWRNMERPSNLTQLHGTADNILPIRFTAKPDVIIKGGSHFMVYGNAKEIIKVVLEIISSN